MKNQKLIRTAGKGIQSYVDYLLGDIQQAEGNMEDSCVNVNNDTDLLDHFMEIEKYVLEEPLSTFGQICGLTTEQFPPEEQLTKTQIKSIVRAFYNLLHSWNLDVVIPKKFPQEQRYKLMVPLLDRNTHIIKNGTSYIEFCDYQPKECPFGSYCDCKDAFDEYTPKKKRSGKTKSSTR
jgi:hypothetical protein